MNSYHIAWLKAISALIKKKCSGNAPISRSVFPGPIAFFRSVFPENGTFSGAFSGYQLRFSGNNGPFFRSVWSSTVAAGRVSCPGVLGDLQTMQTLKEMNVLCMHSPTRSLCGSPESCPKPHQPFGKCIFCARSAPKDSDASGGGSNGSQRGILGNWRSEGLLRAGKTG